MKLKILELIEPYRSLQPFRQEFPTSTINRDKQEIDPICLVGLNGCGKSNMLELIADIFYFLDKFFLEQIYDSKISKPYIPYATNASKDEIYFNIEYTIKVEAESHWVKIERSRGKKKNSSPKFYLRNEEKEYLQFEGEAIAFRKYMPRVIAYTSGLNELLSIPFMELQDYYARAITYQVKIKKETNYDIPAPNLMLMDYASNALVLIANFLLNDEGKLEIFNREETLRVERLDSFRIVIQLDKGGSQNEGIILTKELENYVHKLAKCATSKQVTDEKKGRVFILDYLVNNATKAAFKKAFQTPQLLFDALNKLNLLNTFSIPKKYRTELKKKRETGIPIKFPTIATLDKIFRVEQVELVLSTPKVRTQYINISDGEHQFIHIVGGILLFDQLENEQDILYLFDEPETHFNPQWRSRLFSLIMEKMENYDQEIITTTHSPFILSDCHGYNVFVFERDGETVKFKRAEWETYGSSFSFILRHFFKFENEISKKSYNDLNKLKELGQGDLENLTQQIRLFGDSVEKLYVLKYIEDLQKEASK